MDRRQPGAEGRRRNSANLDRAVLRTGGGQCVADLEYRPVLGRERPAESDRPCPDSDPDSGSRALGYHHHERGDASMLPCGAVVPLLLQGTGLERQASPLVNLGTSAKFFNFGRGTTFCTRKGGWTGKLNIEFHT